MNQLRGHRGVRLFYFCALIALAVFQLQYALRMQENFIGQASSSNTNDPQLLTDAARKLHLLQADQAGAKKLLDRALVTNPCCIPAWLTLAELFNDTGKKETADGVLDYSASLTKDINRYRWEEALTAYQMGRKDILAKDLRYIIANIGGKERNDALNFAFSLWNTPQDLLANLGEGNIGHLYIYAVRKKMPEHTLYFWHEIERTAHSYDKEWLLQGIDMLMNNDRLAEAAALWKKYINPDSLFFNGNFATPLLQEAFSWRLQKNRDVTASIERDLADGQQMLHLCFQGQKNVRYAQASQIVPLSPGKNYRLSFDYKTTNLTTDQLPYIEINGFKCDAQSPVKSDMVQPNSAWTSMNFSFAVDPHCPAVVVSIQRAESTHIDSKITGNLFLRHFAISRVSDQ